MSFIIPNTSFCPEVEAAISDFGFTKPSEIQLKAIPEILAGKDLIGCAQTGTGKTAAFLIPILNKIISEENKKTRCLIICPTRELSEQIDQQIIGFAYHSSVSSIAVYGGNQAEKFTGQKKAIEHGVDIIIATPGRLLSHLNLGYLDLSAIEMLVLDEADRMLDMGFYDDIMKVVKLLPEKRQNLLFSATMHGKIRKLALQILKNPVEINLAIGKPAEGVTQRVYMVHDLHKIQLLEYIASNEHIENMIIFVSKKTEVDQVYRVLSKKFPSGKIHSGIEQHERNQVMLDFKNKKFKFLVATDIISRGIDIKEISHVLNYDIPDDPADYVHRVGRTARADAKGQAISFLNLKDQISFFNIEKLIEQEIEKLTIPNSIGESPAYNPQGQLKSGKNNFRKGGKKPFRNKKRPA